MSNQTIRYLTKSRFKLAVSCPTKLFYTGKSNYANANDEDEFMAMLADGGFQVGELAKLMFPGGIEVNTRNSAEALAKTAEYMALENVVLFEPAMTHDGLLVRVDVLVKRGNVIEVIEVKAKSFSGDPSSLSGKRSIVNGEFLPYVQDVAFQKYVVQKAFPDSTVCAYLLMPDKSKPAKLNGLNQFFKVRRNGRSTVVLVDDRAHSPGVAETVLACVNVDRLANHVINTDIEIPGGQGSLPQLAQLWADHYQRDERIAPMIGAQCAKCEFKAKPNSVLASGFHACWKVANNWTDADFSEGTVLDLWNFRGKDKLIQAGVLKLPQIDLPNFVDKDDIAGELSNVQRQQLQVKGLPEVCKPEGFYLDRQGLSDEMDAWVYPLHMIDFETASVALPFHTGRKPYEQVAFQFSHHVLEKDGTVRHADEFLNAEPGQFPNYAFVRALREALRHDHGTIMRWSHHENSVLQDIKRQLERDDTPPADADELIAFINSIAKGGQRAMVDLADIARKHYFHPSTKGSNSIKKVLPSVMESSVFLRNKYREPIYGTAAGIPSKNFSAMVWWQQAETGAVHDPYQLLVSQMDGHDRDDDEDQASGIKQGGAASYAYLRLQFEDLDPATREELTHALLRYCELDTLAMVMILQAWIDSIYRQRSA